MSEIVLNNPNTDPQSMSEEYEEWNRTVEASISPEEPPERDMFDMVKEHAENESHRCVECGGVIGPLTPPALREQDLCSWRCWAYLYGEVDV